MLFMLPQVTSQESGYLRYEGNFSQEFDCLLSHDYFLTATIPKRTSKLK